jgi:hypothetical protein
MLEKVPLQSELMLNEGQGLNPSRYTQVRSGDLAQGSRN